MSNKLSRILKLLVLPLGSLVLSYIAIRLIDLTNYRPVIYLLSVVAIALPVVSLAIFFQAIIKFKNNNTSIISSAFLSSLFWISIAALANGKSGEEDSQALLVNGALSLGVFTVGASLTMYLIKYFGKQMSGRKK